MRMSITSTSKWPSSEPATAETASSPSPASSTSNPCSRSITSIISRDSSSSSTTSALRPVKSRSSADTDRARDARSLPFPVLELQRQRYDELASDPKLAGHV